VQFNPLDPSFQSLKSVGSTTATNDERREANRDQTQTPLSWDDNPAPFDLFIPADVSFNRLFQSHSMFGLERSAQMQHCKEVFFQ